MNTLRSMNGLIFVEPFPSQGIKSKVTDRLATIEQKVTMTPLKVLIGDRTNYWEGDVVWVNADLFTQPWARKLYTLDFGSGEKTFIALPTSFVNFSSHADNS